MGPICVGYSQVVVHFRPGHRAVAIVTVARAHLRVYGVGHGQKGRQGPDEQNPRDRLPVRHPRPEWMDDGVVSVGGSDWC